MANRLQYEDSPYLQQHKNNPVDWYPWCDEAFLRAKTEHKAIFLSIGYSSCHWCHVMEREVFENAALAQTLNDHFISIKVDKEERPDIDKHFQEVHLLLNRQPGGWPTSIFLTPERKPFFAGTYIPPQRMNGRIGFDELTQIIAQKIAQKDASLFQNADEIAHYLKQSTQPKEATKLDLNIIETFLKQIDHNYDPQYGGFSVEPKFPHTSTLQALLDIAQLGFNPEKTLGIVTHTLDEMQKGGLYDLVDGGFCRYATDQAWIVPHFEKMTYDNGLLCEVYLRAFALTGDESYRATAFETIDFMLEFMQEGGLFYSASDADSDHEEGKYFIYEYETVTKGLAEHFSPHVCEEILTFFSITPQGNFEGHTILSRMSKQRPEWYEKAVALFKSWRKPELYPFIDKKIITSWSAMIVQALFHAALFDAKYLPIAQKTLQTLLNKLYVNETLFHTTLSSKTPVIEAFLEDFAYLGSALVTAYDVTQEETHLVLAQKLANDALVRFYDKGAWLFSKGEFETHAELSDSSYPSSLAVMVDVLLSLGRLVDVKYETFAFDTLERHSYSTMRTPAATPKLAASIVRFLSSETIIKYPHGYRSQWLLEARNLTPYVHFQKSREAKILVCDQKQCFAAFDTPEEALIFLKTLKNRSL